MADLPAVRGLQPQLEAEGIDVLLVSIHGETGQVLTARYAFDLSPTYILFDAAGQEIWRSHSLPTLERVLGLLADL